MSEAAPQLLPAFRVERAYAEALAQTIPVAPGIPADVAGPLTFEFVLSGIATQYVQEHEIVGQQPVWQEVEGWMLCGFQPSVAPTEPAVVQPPP